MSWIITRPINGMMTIKFVSSTVKAHISITSRLKLLRMLLMKSELISETRSVNTPMS